MTIVLAILLAVAGSFAVEAIGGPRPISLRPGDLAIRLISYVLIVVFWFCFSWRPWLAGASGVLTVITSTTINRLKLEVIGESLVFSDVALLRQVPRHPELYYALPLSDARMAGLILFGTAAVLVWYLVEPTLLPNGLIASTLACAALPLVFVLLFFSPRLEPIQRWLNGRFPRPDLEADVRRYGVLATMMAYGLRRHEELLTPQAAGPGPAPARGEDADDAVIVVQLESFLDPTRLGGPPLPVMARVREQATQYGRLRVSAHGAYTMRSEHAVLTGCSPDELGFARFDPYLARRGEEATSLARRALSAGFATCFIHPYHRDFFDRAGVMKRLGFERLVMQEDFPDATRVGPYVGDAEVAARILSEVRARTKPVFICAVTMENHGPWKPGRLPGIDDPLSQYMHHVANTGRALEALLDGLADVRATLCVYGDHPPSLPANRPSAAAPTTDYAIFRLGRPCRTEPRRIDLTADALGCRLRGALDGEEDGSAVAGERLPRS